MRLPAHADLAGSDLAVVARHDDFAHHAVGAGLLLVPAALFPACLTVRGGGCKSEQGEQQCQQKLVHISPLAGDRPSLFLMGFFYFFHPETSVPAETGANLL